MIALAGLVAALAGVVGLLYYALYHQSWAITDLETRVTVVEEVLGAVLPDEDEGEIRH
jgi:hypothetical protein